MKRKIFFISLIIVCFLIGCGTRSKYIAAPKNAPTAVMCPMCQGRGEVQKTTCSTCKGSGKVWDKDDPERGATDAEKRMKRLFDIFQ